MESPTARDETAHQLGRLRARLGEESTQLYQHWALYLQVLRDALAAVVERACFRLAVDEHAQIYAGLPESSRRHLHRRLAALSKRTCVLLTVEQLAVLAQQSEGRRRRSALREQRRLLGSLQQTLAEGSGDDGRIDDPDAIHEPPGSVRLGLGLPINSILFPGNPEAVAAERADAGASPAETDLAEALSSLLDSELKLAGQDHESGSPERLMPQHPLQLLQWIDGLESALARRLRNLSHAINVELVRQGLCKTLLPLRLLDAIAAGDVETQNAPMHLVRLPVPAAGAAIFGTLPDALCVLLRPTDLESEEPRLRTCRSRLQQARQEVRRMAQTYYRLERRLQALDAEALWLHDHSTAQLSNNPPTD